MMKVYPVRNAFTFSIHGCLRQPISNGVYRVIFILFPICYLLFAICTFGQEEIEYTAQDLRDPFGSVLPEEIPKVPEEKISKVPISLPSFTIQGLVWDTPYPQAIINGKVLKIGDTIEDAKIINITKEGIDLIYEGRLFSLPSPGRESLEKKEEAK